MCSASQPWSRAMQDAMRRAKHFFPQQRIAPVAAAERPDRGLLGEVDDVLLLLVAGPGHVRLPGLERHADRVRARHEEAVAQGLQHVAAHARHDPHRHHDIRRIGDLHADVGDWRADRPHAERHDVHGAAAHTSVEESLQSLLHRDGIDPVIGRSRIVPAETADECSVFDPGHIRRVREDQVTVGPLLRVQEAKDPFLHEQLAEPVVFLLRAVAPDHVVGPAQHCHLLDPSPQLWPLPLHFW